MDIQQISSVSGSSLQQNANAASAPRTSSDLGVAKPSAPTVKVSDQAVQAVTQTVDANQLKHAVEKVNKVVQALNSDLQFTVDESTGINVVRVIDTSTKEVIRQFPSKEMLSIAKSIDQLQGLLVKEKI